jgi:hypothetical protein
MDPSHELHSGVSSINSPYILEGKDKKVFERLKAGALDWKLAPSRSPACKTYIHLRRKCYLHGVFIAKSDWRVADSG